MADGTVISSTHRRHRAVEFKKFLTKIEREVPDGLDVHVVCDNYGTHKSPTVTAWLEKHPRFHMHFTPTYSSWINQVERLFAEVTPRPAPALGPPQRPSPGERPARMDQGVEREPEAIHLDQDRRRDPPVPRTTIGTN